jgi:hypothetical protein
MEWLKKGAVTFSLAVGKLEQDLFAQNGSEDILAQNVGIVNPYIANQLMNDLKQGRLTQQVKEFRKKHYQILKESAKYKFKDGQLMSEQEVRQSRVSQGDPHDSYQVEVVFDNKSLGKSLFEEGEVRPMKIQRGVVPRHKIENYTSTVHIRDIDGKNKLIDFYIPNKPGNESIIREIEMIRMNPKVTDLVNFTKMTFTTQDAEMLVFEYKMLAFDKCVEYNGNHIVKMFAECTSDGRWAAEWTQIID